MLNCDCQLKIQLRVGVVSLFCGWIWSIMESVSNGLSHNQARCRLLAWQDIENARKKACSPGVALGLLHAVDLFEARLEKADAEDEYGDTRTTFEDALGISLRHLDRRRARPRSEARLLTVVAQQFVRWMLRADAWACTGSRAGPTSPMRRRNSLRDHESCSVS